MDSSPVPAATDRSHANLCSRASRRCYRRGRQRHHKSGRDLAGRWTGSACRVSRIGRSGS